MANALAEWFQAAKDQLDAAGRNMLVKSYARRHPEIGIMPQVQEQAYANALAKDPRVDLKEITWDSVMADPYVGGWVGPAAIKNAKGIIGDWRWRPMAEVQKDVGLSEVPKYIQQGYGQFMAEQADKAAHGALTPRDLIKSYAITRASVNRGARNIADDLAGNAEAVRPEGYMAEWLLSPSGQRYLNAAQTGAIDESAIADIVRRFKPFGMADTLGGDLRYAAENLPGYASRMPNALLGDREAWRAFAQEMQGIGPSKSGFIASMLGRGDIPTLDARQIALHTGDPAKEAGKYIRRGGGRGGDVAVNRLASRQDQMALDIAPELQPFYQHLTHHAVWDKVGGSQTTHDDIVRAMKLAGIGAVAAPAFDPEFLEVLRRNGIETQ